MLSKVLLCLFTPLTQSSNRGPGYRVRLPRIGPDDCGDRDSIEAKKDVATNWRASGVLGSSKLLAEELKFLEGDAAPASNPTPEFNTDLSRSSSGSVAGENASVLSGCIRSKSPVYLHPSLGVNTARSNAGPSYEELLEAFQLRLRCSADVDKREGPVGEPKEVGGPRRQHPLLLQKAPKAITKSNLFAASPPLSVFIVCVFPHRSRQLIHQPKRRASLGGELLAASGLVSRASSGGSVQTPSFDFTCKPDTCAYLPRICTHQRHITPSGHNGSPRIAFIGPIVRDGGDHQTQG